MTHYRTEWYSCIDRCQKYRVFWNKKNKHMIQNVDTPIKVAINDWMLWKKEDKDGPVKHHQLKSTDRWQLVGAGHHSGQDTYQLLLNGSQKNNQSSLLQNWKPIIMFLDQVYSFLASYYTLLFGSLRSLWCMENWLHHVVNTPMEFNESDSRCGLANTLRGWRNGSGGIV